MKRADAHELFERMQERRAYHAAEREVAKNRRVRGRVLLAERFRLACRDVAARDPRVALRDVKRILDATVIDLTLGHVRELAVTARLTVTKDDALVRDDVFTAFIQG